MWRTCAVVVMLCGCTSAPTQRVLIDASAVPKADNPRAADFVTVWKTDNPGVTGPTKVRIGTGDGVFDYDIDWDNDGVFDDVGVKDTITHDYGRAGTYTVRIRGAFPHLRFARMNGVQYGNVGDAPKLVGVAQWGDTKWESMREMFRGCRDLVFTAKDKPDTSRVRSMYGIFEDATNFDSDVSGWDTSQVTDMTNAFHGAEAFNQPLESWDVSQVRSMAHMFRGAHAFNQPLEGWDMRNVEITGAMFLGARSFNQPLDAWRVNNVITMSFMFEDAYAFNQPLGHWDTGKVQRMAGMFRNARSFNHPVDGWDISSLRNTMEMFLGATSFTHSPLPVITPRPHKNSKNPLAP